MFALALGARGVAHMRFAISPLQEVCGLLELVGRPERAEPDQRAAVDATRAAIRDCGLELIDALTGAPGYLPDLLTPHPNGADGDVDVELRAVRDTDPERVLAELDAMHGGRPAAGLPGRPVAAPVAAALRDGPVAFAARAADELGTLWQQVLAGRWPRIRAALTADIGRRAEHLARSGAAAVLAGLHPAISWDDAANALRVESPYRAHVACDDTLVLVPSAVRRRPNVLIDPCAGARRPPVVCYPVPIPAPAPRTPAELIGTTRARLLCDLHRPRTTTELARRHHLTPSSVSYHLGVLHRTGLVSRTRDGARVLYVRTVRADALL